MFLQLRDESERFLSALAGVTEPEAKRKIIGREFIRSFEAAQKQVVEQVGASGGEVKFLVQGTLYPDVVESGGGEGAANIKSHHNVGGLPEDCLLYTSSIKTVETHVSAVLRKLQLSNRNELTHWAMQRHII